MTIRRALDLNSWEAATARIRAWEAAGKLGGDEPTIVTVRDAISLYLKDTLARALRPLMERPEMGWCQ